MLLLFVKIILVIYVLKNTGKLVVNPGKTQGIQSKPERGHPGDRTYYGRLFIGSEFILVQRISGMV